MKTATMVALPLAAWFLWDTSSYWLPENRWIPIVSYFRRQWKSNPSKQMLHVKMVSELVIFGLIAYQLIMDKDDANSIRGATASEKKDIERGIDQMMQADLESHAKCMDTLLVKHKIAME
eukprot:TRINITY_DN33258_c0_g1_i1.p2 TRINITY_DN33258_c0_g1~~TRINITY_DN33258_c0_g1_i1.p2  ORF type:complete len:120 (+),score=30.37 TRINITY_DN33258_c0_g1_i1:47-406(+)